MDSAIRLVRCPNCRKILAELPNNHLHTCEGCGTVLEAKKHKDDIKGNALRAQEADPIQKDELSHMNDAIRLVRCPKCRKIVAELPNIHGHTCMGCGASLQANEHKDDMKGDGLRAQETYPILKDEPSHTSDAIRLVRCPKCRKILAELPNINLHTCTACGASLQDIEHKNDIKGNGLRVQETDRIQKDQPSHMNDAIRLVRCPKCRKIVAELPNIHGHTCTGCGASLQANEHENGIKGNGSRAQETDSIHKYEPSFGLRNIGNEIGQYSPDTEDFHSELALEEEHSNEPQSFDDNSRSHLEKSSGPEKCEEITAPGAPLIRSMVFAPLSTDEIYLKESAQVSPSFDHTSKEEMLDSLPINTRVAIALFSPDNIHMEESHEVSPSLHHISSDDMLDKLPINPRAPIGSMSKSPTKTYYGGDERESSYDETEELSAQVSESINIFRHEGRSRVKNKQNDQFQMLNERQDRRRHESSQPRKQRRPIRTLVIEAHNEPVSGVSYKGRSSELLDKNESPGSSTYSIWLDNGEFHEPDTVLDPDSEKVELVRIVYELEDNIKRAHVSKQMSGERLPFRDAREEIRTGRNPYVDPQYYGHHRSHPQGVGRANQPRISSLTFSGEARCSHCHHQDSHFSPKLSMHCIHCQHVVQPMHDYINMYPSYSPSPKHYSTPEFSDEVQADNKKLDHEMKMLHLRDKHQVTKRHLRPVSGAAPIITCYHCSELLQLSADFILFRRRCHRIRCNSCNRILKFALLKKSHLVPYVIKIQAHSPIEIDNYSNIQLLDHHPLEQIP